MNRRDFLRGVIVAAPAVILTPGLLMKVRPFPRTWAHQVAFNNTQVRLWLEEANDILQRMEFVEQPDIGLTVARSVVRTGLPTALWRKLVLPEGA